MAGRRPVPDEIKDLTGSHNKRNGASPRYYVYRDLDAVKPLKIVEGNPFALEYWNATVPDLVSNGLLTRANIGLFASMCCEYAAWMKASELVEERGEMIEDVRYDKDGKIASTSYKANPMLAEARHARMAMLRCAVEFGLTPAAATRVHATAEDGKPKDDFSSFVSGDEDEAPRQLN